VRKKKDDYYPSKHITTLSQEHTDMTKKKKSKKEVHPQAQYSSVKIPELQKVMYSDLKLNEVNKNN